MIDEQHLRDLIEEQITRHMEGCQKTTMLLDARLKQIEDQSDKQAEHVTRLSLVMFGDSKLNVAGLVMQMSQIRKLMYVAYRCFGSVMILPRNSTTRSVRRSVTPN